MKKKIFALCALVVVISILISITTIGASSNIDKENRKIPKFFEEKMKKEKNAPGFDKTIVPMSSAARFILENKEQLMRQDGVIIEPVMGQETEELAVLPPSTSDMRFNKEIGNLHQNEESVAVWTSPGKPTLVVGGANEYRGDWGVLGGMSGYYVSKDNGNTTLREGALPKLNLINKMGEKFSAISAGDPVLDVNKTDGTFFYASLYMNDTMEGIGLAKAVPSNLTNSGLPDSKVWQPIQVIATDSYYVFYDKPWMTVDNAAASPYKGYIYVTWTNFSVDFLTVNTKIEMARCKMNPFVCTTVAGADKPVSGSQSETQFSKVSVDSDGNVVVTWIEYASNPNVPYIKQKVWVRTYAPGGTVALTPPKLVTTINRPVEGLDAMQGNEFRIHSGVWSESAKVGGVSRLYVTNSECADLYLINYTFTYNEGNYAYGGSCSNVNTYFRYIDNYNTETSKVSGPIPLENSANKHSFFPTMSVNQAKKRLDIAWYETKSKYDYSYTVALQQRNLTTPTIVTIPTSDIGQYFVPDAEVYFGTYGYFIGDYFQITTEPGIKNRIFIHYNGNPRSSPPTLYTYTYNSPDWSYTERLMIGGNQQDNRLYTKTYS